METTGRPGADLVIQRGLIDRSALLAYFEAIEPRLYRYPAVDPASLRRAVETTGRQR